MTLNQNAVVSKNYDDDDDVHPPGSDKKYSVIG